MRPIINPLHFAPLPLRPSGYVFTDPSNKQHLPGMETGTSLEDLPAEILICIVSKISFGSSVVSEHDELQNLRLASPLIDSIVRKHEYIIASRISAEQFPLAYYSLGGTGRGLRHVNLLSRQTSYVEDLINLGRQQRSTINYDTYSVHKPGWSMWPDNWERIVRSALWFLQCNGSSSANLATTACVIDRLPGYGCLILRHTTLFLNELFCLLHPNLGSSPPAFQRLGIYHPDQYGPLLEVISWKCPLTVTIKCLTDTSWSLDTLNAHLMFMLKSVKVQEAAENRREALNMLGHGICAALSRRTKRFHKLVHYEYPVSYPGKLIVGKVKKMLDKDIGGFTTMDIVQELLPDRRQEPAVTAATVF